MSSSTDSKLISIKEMLSLHFLLLSLHSSPHLVLVYCFQMEIAHENVYIKYFILEGSSP